VEYVQGAVDIEVITNARFQPEVKASLLELCRSEQETRQRDLGT
jgi:hypothetical protein